MTYRPSRKNLISVYLSGGCMVLAVVAFYIASKVRSYMALYQVAAIVFAVCALQIFLKYVQSDYVYKADEHDLKIYKVTGNKSICVCSLSYEESLSGIITAEQFNQNKERYPATKISVNYCKNIFPADYGLYFFNFNSKPAVLKFEPDEIFIEYVNKKISAAMSRKENEENCDE